MTKINLTYNQIHTIVSIFKEKNVDFNSTEFFNQLGRENRNLNKYTYPTLKYINLCILDLMNNLESNETYYDIQENKTKKISLKVLSNIKSKLYKQLYLYDRLKKTIDELIL
tara:strand:+ start:39 stop:374 length:336 start_codon:yes stop_codon:yes gene_type:complete